MWEDLKRWAREEKIPFRGEWPPNYPNTPTAAVQRALLACSCLDPERYLKAVDAMYFEIWGKASGVQSPEVFHPILTKVLGEEMANEVVCQSSSEEMRELLRKNTDEALASGAPGMPWMVAVNSQGKEDHFWGFDHLGLVARHLGIQSMPTSLL